MKRLPLILALIWGMSASLQAGKAPARVLALDGPCQADGKPLVLGQSLALGTHVKAGPGGTAHLVLAAGSSVVLAADSEVVLAADEVELLGGTLGLFAADPIELKTPNARVRLLAGSGEVAASSGDTTVSVDEGGALLGDLKRKKTEKIKAQECGRLFGGRMMPAAQLPKRESGDLRARWERSKVFHEQREQILMNLK